MERAGAAVARACLDLLGGAYGRRVVVVCGTGNNGGDGAVAARYLARRGVRVTMFAPADGAPGSLAADMVTRARDEAGVPVRTLDHGLLVRELARADLAVDAIFGTGFHGTPDDAMDGRDRGVQRGRGP